MRNLTIWAGIAVGVLSLAGVMAGALAPVAAAVYSLCAMVGVAGVWHE